MSQTRQGVRPPARSTPDPGPPPVGIRAWPARYAAWRRPAKLRVGVIGGAVTLACSLALLPIAAGGWWLNKSLVAVAALVAAGAVMRMLRMPLPLLPIGSTAVLASTLCALFAPQAAGFGFVPTPTALATLRGLLEAGRSDAWATVPPAEQTPGLLLIVVASVGVVALMVDTLAAGLDLPGLALIPLAGLYAAPWIVGAGFPPTASLVLLLACWLALLSAHERYRVRAAIPTAEPGPALPGAAAVACCLVATVAVASWLPVAGDGKRADGMRPLGLSVDPIVSLRRALVSTTGEVVLTYQTTAERPDYLRLAVLDRFDGQQWTASEARTAGVWPRSPDAEWARYALEIGPLLGSVIPSPVGTATAQTDDQVFSNSAGLPQRSGSGVRDSRADLRVRAPAWTASQLRQAAEAPVPAPAGLAADPTPLTGPEVGRLAREVTAGLDNRFDQAVALQDWFTKDGKFRYSTATSDAAADINLFLTERVGYCEQFAATMAAMARSLGIPARVLVGFTPGSLVDGTWTVTDANAHAWPELWLGSAGWVRFEPTPRTDSISIPAYALPEQTGDGESAAPRPTSSRSAAPVDQGNDVEGTAAAETADSSGAVGFAPIAAGILVAFTLSVPAALRRARRRRALRGNDPELAYREIVDTMVDLRVETPAASERATLGRAVAGLPDPARNAADRVATAVEQVRYGPPTGGSAPARGDAWRSRETSRETGTQAGSGADAELVVAAMSAAAPRGRRLLGVILPRSLRR